MVKSPSEDRVVDGRTLTVTNPDKVLYPQTGFTKRQVVDYVERISPVALRHVHDRPLTLHRFPNGVEAPGFYEKQCPKHRPDWFQTADVPVSDKVLREAIANDASSLVWLANLASLELHPLLARSNALQEPTKITFDLDPGQPATVIECCRVALLLRELLHPFGLELFPKTSGSKGLQVELPLHSGVTYERTRPFAQAVAQLMENRHGDLVVSQMEKAVRVGKVFVDWSQNTASKTTIAPYSLRARPRHSVSTPISWDEVEDAVAHKDPEALVFLADDVLERVATLGDLHEPVETLVQELPALSV